MPEEKPRYRVPANTGIPTGRRTADGFNNFLASVGTNTDNVLGAGVYTYAPISRNRFLLDAIYRTSPIAGMAVDVVADDMTQAGITFVSEMDPKDSEILYEGFDDLGIWDGLNKGTKWSRLYGTGVAVALIDGQTCETPLNMDSIGLGSFLGIAVMDRWQLQPDLSSLIQNSGRRFGMPEFYDMNADGLMPNLGRIHHSRMIRLDAIPLPHSQAMAENMWAESVIERMYDRLLAFDSATLGVAQLMFKAYLRTWKVKNLRINLAAGGKFERDLARNMMFIRRTQTNEGLTLIDAEDEFDTHQYNFAGTDAVLLQLAMQISGAIEIPLVRLLGQSPGGLNSTGEGDLRTYYDGISKKQHSTMKVPLKWLLEIMSRSLLGKPLPPGFRFNFNSLWKLDDEQKGKIAKDDATTITSVYAEGLISAQCALKELRGQSAVTGRFSNITDEDIEAADDEPPKMAEMMPGAEGSGGDEGGDGEGKGES